jgi:signal transduction histidine kinase/ActR/RegA family two-component response regulator
MPVDLWSRIRGAAHSIGAIARAPCAECGTTGAASPIEPAEEPQSTLALRRECERRLAAEAALTAMARERQELAGQISFFDGAFHHWLETTPEQLLIVDATGRIEGSSRAAREALHLGSSLASEARLEDLFVDEADRAVGEWLDGLATKRLDRFLAMASSERAFAITPADRSLATFSPDRLLAAPPLDALLRGGSPVRLAVRAQWPGARSPAHSWLVALEELNSNTTSAEEEQRTASELSALLDSLESGVLLFGGSGQMRASNDRFAKMMGLDPGAVRELRTFERLVETLSARFAHPAKFAERWRERGNRAEEAARDEIELARPARKVIERFTRPIRDSRGNRLGWIEVYRDITSQRVNQSKQVQTEKMASLGQLVSGIAHELNNPLTSIQGYAQLLLGRRSAPDQLADAKHICEEAERAGRIVKNLLLFARETKFERRPVDVNEVVERALALRSYELKVENIETALDLDPRLPAILADASQLLQVVLNLVINAEQAIAEARGRSTASPGAPEPDHIYDRAHEGSLAAGHIRIRTRHVSDQRLALEVSDDGPGIPLEAIPRIFDPFFTTKVAGVGTGLGLSIAYGIVREHGGEISVESERGDGAKFVVELSAAAATSDIARADAAPAMLAPLALVPSERGHKLATRAERILVVEDEPTVAQLIVDVLTEDGYRVDKLLDSRQAIERTQTHNYDLVVCDLKMPHVDGRAFYRALADAESPLRYRFVFVTGDTLSPHTLEFLESSGLPYLAKPFFVEELQQVVQQAFARVQIELPRVAGGNHWPRAITRKR